MSLKEKIQNASPVLAYIVVAAAIILTIVVIAAVVAVIVSNPGSAVAIIVSIIIGLIIVAAIIILLQIFVAIRYAAKGPQTQTDMSYDIKDQEHAESFDEAKDVPPSRK